MHPGKVPPPVTVVWRVRESICWLPQRGESSGESVKVIGLLSEKEGLRESSGESSGESVNVIGWLASP